MSTEGTLILFGLMKFCKSLKRKECENCHTLVAILQGMLPLHNRMEGPCVVSSLTSLSFSHQQSFRDICKNYKTPTKKYL